MSRRRRKFVPYYRRYFRCPVCKTINTATKRIDRRTPPGHRKPLYCWKCKKETLHIQISN